MSATPKFRVTCDDCPDYELEPRYSRPTATWEAEFHDDLIHQDDQKHATVEVVDR